MHLRHWFRSSRRTLAVFLGTMWVLGGALTWLCWQLLEQDRQLESQRAQDRLEQAADRAVAGLASGVQDLDAWLPLTPAAKTEPPPAGLVLLLKSEDGVKVWPASLLVYQPARAPAEKNLDDIFATGERMEFQGKDAAGAAANFRALAESRAPEVRAGALLRLARDLRKLGRYGEALDVYGRLAEVGSVTIEGVPAGLTALDARCGVLEAMGRRAEMKKEALPMDSGLRSGRWPLPGAALGLLPGGGAPLGRCARAYPERAPCAGRIARGGMALPTLAASSGTQRPRRAGCRKTGPSHAIPSSDTAFRWMACTCNWRRGGTG